MRGSGRKRPEFRGDDVTCVCDDVTYGGGRGKSSEDDVTCVYDDVTYVYDDVTYCSRAWS